MVLRPGAVRRHPASALLLLAGLVWPWPAAAQDRVVQARRSKGAIVAAHFKQASVPYPPRALLLRAFKAEQELEVWASDGKAALTLVTTYRICALSGGPGPKRKEGDGQIPEGFYVVDRFNPRSNYHLSLGLDYPNRSDRLRSDRVRPGGDIFIHGNCVTIGCLPIEDGPMEELYVMALDARGAGVRRIPVHIFPARMRGPRMQQLRESAQDKALLSFWDELLPAFDAFEQTRKAPKIIVEKDGRYQVEGR